MGDCARECEIVAVWSNLKKKCPKAFGERLREAEAYRLVLTLYNPASELPLLDPCQCPCIAQPLVFSPKTTKTSDKSMQDGCFDVLLLHRGL